MTNVTNEKRLILKDSWKAKLILPEQMMSINKLWEEITTLRRRRCLAQSGLNRAVDIEVDSTSTVVVETSGCCQCTPKCPTFGLKIYQAMTDPIASYEWRGQPVGIRLVSSDDSLSLELTRLGGDGS